MYRRQFLKDIATASVSLATVAQWQAPLWAEELPKDVRVIRVVGFSLKTKRSKVAGKNSRKDVHGDNSRDQMLWLHTNQGIDGLGTCNVPRHDAEKLLGTDLFTLFRPEQRRMTGSLGVGTMPLWDLAGKALGKPVHELLGGKGGKTVGVYDGSIYFADLLPQYAGRWQDRFREEIDMGRKIGHTAFKVKIGRGAKWMKRAEGDQRDLDVIKLIRQHGGKDLVIGVDANNGYDLSGAKRFMEQVGDLNIAFAEEMFPETVKDCLAFKKQFADHGWKTLLADGETQRNIDVFKPFIEAGAIDVLQADMKRFGFEGILRESAMSCDKDILIAPHNWGSLLGYYMQLQVGRAIPNFYRAERDPLSTEVLIADGYSIRDGQATVPDAPGIGLKLDRQRFAADVKVDFDVKL